MWLWLLLLLLCVVLGEVPLGLVEVGSTEGVREGPGVRVGVEVVVLGERCRCFVGRGEAIVVNAVAIAEGEEGGGILLGRHFGGGSMFRCTSGSTLA